MALLLLLAAVGVAAVRAQERVTLLNGTNITCCPCAAPAPPGCADFANPGAWFRVRNDSCACPWDCLDCNGGISTPVVAAEPWGQKFCVCDSTDATFDCRGCREGGCPADANCDTSMFILREKTYSCIPDVTFQGFFAGGGLFIFTISFPDSRTPVDGVAQLSGYAFPDKSPLLFSCDLTGCSRAARENNQQISCATINCVSTGADDTLGSVVEALAGQSTVVFDATGRAEMFQAAAPVVVIMYCEASACEFPGDTDLEQSRLSTILAAAFGGLIAAAIIVLIVFCVLRANRLKRLYEAFGSRRIERTIAWSDVACTLRFWVPSGSFSKKRKVLEVLKGMSGSAEPGTMTALMGESGSGKTALLDVLARRKTLGRLEGEVLVNGAIPGTEWKRISGYVLQEDVFIPTQTAREHLTFVSRLKLPADMANEQRDERVDTVLQEVGLSHVAETQIGDANHKGLSGGEKKRLSIASELLSDPAILFLDEPTSGLDSVNAFRVMSCLHTLAVKRGKTIIFAIHSPDSALFQLFSNVIILAKGHLVYSGSRDNLLPAMERLAGKACPAQYNPADFAIHVIANVPEENLPQLAAEVGRGDPAMMARGGMQGSQEIGKAFATEAYEMDDIGHARSNDLDAANAEDYAMAKEQLVGSIEESERLGAYNQAWIFQVGYIMKRSLADSWRNPYLLRLQYVLIISAALVLGGMFYQMDNTLAGAQNRSGLLFFICTLLTVITLPSIDTFFSERAVFFRERGAGYYSASAYFVAKALADVVPLRLVPPILLTCITYPMSGLRFPASYFFWFMLGKFSIVWPCFSFSRALFPHNF